MVVRLAENGCLLHQLKKNRENPNICVREKDLHFSQIDKTRIARDVASGMLHLTNKKVNICYSKVKTVRLKLIAGDDGGVLWRSANSCKLRWLTTVSSIFKLFGKLYGLLMTQDVTIATV